MAAFCFVINRLLSFSLSAPEMNIYESVRNTTARSALHGVPEYNVILSVTPYYANEGIIGDVWRRS